MAQDLSRASGFLSRLLSNPALQVLSPTQKGEQIDQFLRVNAQALYPTLSSASFFPGLQWPDIHALLIEALAQIVDSLLVKELEKVIHNQIDFTFLSFIQQYRIPVEKCQEQLLDALQKGLGRPQMRSSISGSLTALQHDLPDRYMERSFERRQYVHFELMKVQRLKMSKEEVKNMISASLLVRPLIGLATSAAPGSDDHVTGLVQSQFAEKAFAGLKTQLKFIPEALLKSGLHASVSFLDNDRIEATSRIAAIFLARGRTYRPEVKVDRGADTPDKSWLRIARKNAKVYGFDVKMLDEFFKIAADNSW